MGQWVAGDFDGDGKVDMALAFEDGGNISIDVHVNQGCSSGPVPVCSFKRERWATQQGGWPDAGQWMAGDFNGDGKADMALAFEDDGDISIDVHTSQGGLFTLERWATKRGGWPDAGQWVAGDFNGDRRLDLALAFEDGDDISIDVHPNEGCSSGPVPVCSFGFERWATKKGGWPDAGQWVAGDFNGDRRLDLALAFEDGDDISIDVHPNEGCLPGRTPACSFGFARWATHQGTWPDSQRWLAGDFNKDGKADMAMAFEDGGLISIDVHASMENAFVLERWGTLDGGWVDASGWVAGDFDRNGTLDLAKAFEDNGAISIDVHRMGPIAHACLPWAAASWDALFEDSELGDIESNEMQGLAETSSHWYWMSRFKIQRVASGGAMNSPVDASVEFPGAFRALGYDHFGDGDIYGDRLYVPITGEGRVPAVLAYDLDLNLVAWGTLPKGGGAWVSINPRDGHLYTSEPFTTLRAYDIKTLTPFSGNPADQQDSAGLGYIGHIELEFNRALPKSCPTAIGDVCALWWADAWIQGGDFSPNGVLYYVLDHASADHNNDTGVHVFDVPPFPSRIGTQTAREVNIEGMDQKGYLSVEYLAFIVWPPPVGKKRADELEGITVYRGQDNLIHVLLAKLSNELDDDDVTVYQWITNEPRI